MNTHILAWESAGTDEPGDQNADSHAVHGYWSLGPDSIAGGQWGVELLATPTQHGWAVELIVIDDGGEEIPTEGAHLGRFDTEADAKAAAQQYEWRLSLGPTLGETPGVTLLTADQIVAHYATKANNDSREV